MAHGHGSLLDNFVNKLLGGHAKHEQHIAAAASIGVPMPHAQVPHWMKNVQKKLLKFCDIASWASPVPPPESEENGVMFGCVPLRTGTFFVASFFGVMSWFFLFFRGQFFTYLRWFVGGYDVYSKITLSLALVPGCMFGFLGAAGAWYMSPAWIQHYIRYLTLQLPAAAVVYYFDMQQLWGCPMWRQDAGKAIKVYGWSPVIYEVALDDLCDEEKNKFLILSGFRLLLLVYIISATQRYFDQLETEPKWLLRLPKGLERPSGAFRLKKEEKEEKPRMEYGATPQMPDMVPRPMPGINVVGPPMMAPGMMPGMMPPGSMPGMGMPPGMPMRTGMMPPPGSSMPPMPPPGTMMPPGPMGTMGPMGPMAPPGTMGPGMMPPPNTMRF